MLRLGFSRQARQARSLGCSIASYTPPSERIRTWFLHHRRALATASTPLQQERIPLRQQLKAEAKREKAQKRQKGKADDAPSHDGWELTVGLEIHAQLNTAAKLFSSGC